MGKRRTFTSDFKVKLVLELLKEEKTLGELAQEHSINPNQLTQWRREFLEKAPEVFTSTKEEKAHKKAEQRKN